MNSALTILATLALAASPAIADDILTNDDGVVRDYLCVGQFCLNNETYQTENDSLRIKRFDTRIHFDDMSLPTGLHPFNDWRIVANDSFPNGQDYLAFTDVTGGTTPFKVMGGARENALRVQRNGRIGIGTSLPQSDMHIVSNGSTATLRIEETSGTPQAYELRVDNSVGFRIRDNATSNFPFYIQSGAITNAVNITPNGDIGLGTSAPAGKLHTLGTGTQLIYFQSTDGGPVQLRFRTNSENRRFIAVNNANQVRSQIVFGDNQIQFLGATVAQEWLRISSAGIVSSGPTCNPNPCDATFDPEAFTVPPIEERAAYMWENKHLPAVGPTEPGQPFNLTEKTAGMLHELEVAHIYIDQLHTRMAAQQAEIAALKAGHDAQLAQVLARLDRLEAPK